MSNFPAKGIGAVYTDHLAKHGYDVILVARNEAGLTALFRAPRPWHGCSGRSPSSRSDVEIGPRSRWWHGRFGSRKEQNN